MLFAIATLLSPMNLRFSRAIVPATLMSFSFCSTRLARPFKSPLTPSTFTFTLLIAVVLLAMLVVLASTFTLVASIRLLLSTIALALASTLTFTLLIAVVFLAILVVLLAIFVVLFSTLPLILVICFLISLITVED